LKTLDKKAQAEGKEEINLSILKFSLQALKTIPFWKIPYK